MLFRNAEAIESLREIDTLVLDKTGTLTVGRPAFDRVLTVGAWKANELLALAAGLDRSSEHPLARAIVEGAASSANTPAAVSDFQSVTGRGVTGTHKGRKLALGNLALMNDVRASVEPVIQEVDSLRKSGAPSCSSRSMAHSPVPSQWAIRSKRARHPRWKPCVPMVCVS